MDTFSASAFGAPLPLSCRWRKKPGGITLTNMIVSAANATDALRYLKSIPSC